MSRLTARRFVPHRSAGRLLITDPRGFLLGYETGIGRLHDLPPRRTLSAAFEESMHDLTADEREASTHDPAAERAFWIRVERHFRRFDGRSLRIEDTRPDHERPGPPLTL